MEPVEERGVASRGAVVPAGPWECGCGVSNRASKTRCGGCCLEYAQAMRRTQAAVSGVGTSEEPTALPGYLTLLNPQTKQEVLIKRGFIWPACVIPVLWTLSHGMFGAFFLWIGGWFLGSLLVQAGMPFELFYLARLAGGVLFGIHANTIVEAHYRSRGYVDAFAAATEDSSHVELDSSGVMVVRRPLEYGDGCPLCGYPYYSAGAAGVYKCDGCRGQFRVVAFGAN